ncbi:MAG: hypothetical protein COA78_12550 [Blastopirellula sp.]|nr:MAG: hypothetical protein COA78_12550 [Blastopirellula sp.]
MSSFSDQDINSEDASHQYQQYRSLSAVAVVALFLGMISLLGLMAISMLPIAVGGIAIGLFAISSVTKNAEHVSGKPVAILGTVLSVFSLVAGASWFYYDEYVDIPEGYTVMQFGELQPDTEAIGKAPVPERAWKYDGEQILVKGYVYPHDKKNGLTRFVLVPDFDTCCFGGQPKITDMIEVHLKNNLKVDFSWNRRKIGGKLTINKQLKQIHDLKGVYYELDADYID